MGRPSLARTLPAVYGVAALRVLFPFVALPLMAARLGAEDFGRLSQLLVWSTLISVLVEGGFGAAATRDAVGADADGRAALARQVFSARCALSLPAAAAALALGAWGAADWRDPLLLAVLAVVSGWPAQWYLQATGQLHRFALDEAVLRVLWLGALFAAGHSIEAYLLINALAIGAMAWLGWRYVRADLGPLRLWSAADCRRGLALGGTMLPVSVAGAAYSYALPAVAATQLPRAELGLYYLADRWVRALLMAAEPLLQQVYPRIVERFRHGARAALRYALGWAAAGGLAGALLLGGGALALTWAGPWLPAGMGSPALAAVLAVNAWLLPLLLAWKPVGLWMLGSRRFDTAYRACMFSGAVAGVGAVAFGLAHDAVALAWIALGVEALVIGVALAGIWGSLRWASTSTT